LAEQRQLQPQRQRGFGRFLVAVYAVFTVAAGSRAAVQIALKFSEAPIAYLLSALAAVVYVLATIGLLRVGRGGRGLAVVSCSIELAGVVVIGAVSLFDRAAFPDETVWSGFGRGYLYIPLVLPIVALWWLLRHGNRPAGPGSGSAVDGGRPADPPIDGGPD
jgi:cytochrome bd-type quinol oxidase subunit 2